MTIEKVIQVIWVIAKVITLIGVLKSWDIANKYEEKGAGYKSLKWMMIMIMFQNLMIWGMK